MVTFALPGDYDAASETSGTPKSRPALPFAKRTYVATPYATKRFSTPQSSARKAFTTRDEVPSSSLNQNGMTSSRNIFRASTACDTPSAMPFSPSLPQSTMKKVFAPGVTPEPSRVYRESTAKATPRGVASHASEKELFNMRIASPPPELTGEVLANKVPKDWNSNGSIYADQFLSHLCPLDLDDEQRRQFFCILDLRRLKYAANEIFSKKSWKLNVINFAKEFEKSRSIILLRYGLYEFQNVKPSKDVLKRWRREHGLPDPSEYDVEDADPTPTKPAMSKKRKADDNLTKGRFFAESAKRRVTVRDEADEPTAVTPAPSKNKRRGSLSESDEQPSKLQKGPSSAKSLFEKIASKSSTTPALSPTKTTTPSKPPSKLFEGAAVAKSSLFGSEPVSTPVPTSVLSPSKPPSAAGTPSSNIFGYLSDTGSAKNSAVDADADAESDTDSEQGDSQEAGQGDDHSGATSGAGESDSQSSLFNAKPEATGFGTATSSATGTRESTPGRSLFDRVTKDNDGQPLRASQAALSEEPAPKSAPLNQTWNPNTSPIKFAPKASAATNSLFGLGGSASNSLFGTKTSAASNLFGPSKSLDKEAPKPIQKDISGGESDKENESRPSKRPAAEARPALQPNGTSSLFATKPASTEAAKETGSSLKPTTTSLFGSATSEMSPTKPATNLFASTPKTSLSTKPATSLFGSAAKPDVSFTPSLFGAAPKDAPTMQSSTLFGAKPAEPAQKEEKKPEIELPKTNSLFGASGTSGTTANLFTPKPATNGTSLFGGASSTPSTNLFGSTPAVTAPAKVESATTSQPTAAPVFSFGASALKPTETSQAAAVSLFGTPKSPQTFDESNMQGSPMNQDQASPTKKPVNGTGIDSTQPPPVFSFGAPTSTPAPSLFGSNVTPAATSVGGTSNIFGGSTPAASGTSGPASFNFNFGGSSTSSGGTTLNNPFASANTANTSAPAPASSSGSLFSFGASSAPSAPSGGSGGMFQFGASSNTPAASSSAPIFGSASAPGSTSVNASQQPSSTMFTFGGNQATSGFGSTLQPPAGGSSTTGTNSPFNLGGGSSLATTPAGGTPEPSTQAAATSVPDNNDEEGEKHEQINLTDGTDKDEEVLHDVRAKVLKFVSGDAEGEEKKAKSKSPWVTQGVGPLRLLKNKETNTVRLLLRAEPRGNVALNKLLLPNLTYKSDEKYVKLTTSNDKGDGLETWMLQVKTKDAAKAFAQALEKNKDFNKKN